METPLFNLIDNLSIGELLFLFLLFACTFFVLTLLFKTIISNKEEIKQLKKLQNEK